MINETTAWLNLEKNAESLKKTKLSELFDDATRAENFSVKFAGISLDYSKNYLTKETLSLLLKLPEAANLSEAIEAMFTGKKINSTENRAVLHTALRNRSNQAVLLDGHNVMTPINATLEKMASFVERVQTGDWLGFSEKRITDIVNIGIGGSDLGPHMVVKALENYRDKHLRSHFVSNIDPTHLTQTLDLLDPETTLFIIASKTFTTEETMTNATAARDWLLNKAKNEAAIEKHFVAVSASPDKAVAFGVDEKNIFAFWDFVGGRYSLWSAIGLSIALSIGMDNFEELLSGAHDMDKHFRNTAFENNMPVILALIGIWYRNFFDAQTYAVIPYSQSLSLLPSFLQQLDMESNGKSVTRDGERVTYKTGPIVWGSPGSNGQHAFHQLLHQGTDFIPVDFILTKTNLNPIDNQHTRLSAHCLAQAEALLLGRATDNIHRDMTGNKPSNVILLDKITPRSLGALIALYEHKVFVQGIIWNINSFDQWGVELGKQLATTIFKEISGQQTGDHDNSTQRLMAQVQEI